MNESEFKKGIEGIRNIKMESGEKSSILKNIFNAPVASPYLPQRRFSLSYIWASVSLVGALAAFIIYNAENALPGDILYGVKVGFSEPVRSLLTWSPERRAKWESAKAIRRLDEAADLALKGKLDTKTRADIENLFSMHVDSFIESISQTASSTPEANLIKNQFQANVSAKVQVLESLGKDLEETKKQYGNVEIIDENISLPDSGTSSAATSSQIETGEESPDNVMELKKLEDAVHKKLKGKN